MQLSIDPWFFWDFGAVILQTPDSFQTLVILFCRGLISNIGFASIFLWCELYYVTSIDIPSNAFRDLRKPRITLSPLFRFLYDVLNCEDIILNVVRDSFQIHVMNHSVLFLLVPLVSFPKRFRTFWILYLAHHLFQFYFIVVYFLLNISVIRNSFWVHIRIWKFLAVFFSHFHHFRGICYYFIVLYFNQFQTVLFSFLRSFSTLIKRFWFPLLSIFIFTLNFCHIFVFLTTHSPWLLFFQIYVPFLLDASSIFPYSVFSVSICLPSPPSLFLVLTNVPHVYFAGNTTTCSNFPHVCVNPIFSRSRLLCLVAFSIFDWTAFPLNLHVPINSLDFPGTGKGLPFNCKQILFLFPIGNRRCILCPSFKSYLWYFLSVFFVTYYWALNTHLTNLWLFCYCHVVLRVKLCLTSPSLFLCSSTWFTSTSTASSSLCPILSSLFATLLLKSSIAMILPTNFSIVSANSLPF